MCILLNKCFTQDVLDFLEGQGGEDPGLSKMPVIISLRALLIHTCAHLALKERKMGSGIKSQNVQSFKKQMS